MIPGGAAVSTVKSLRVTPPLRSVHAFRRVSWRRGLSRRVAGPGPLLDVGGVLAVFAGVGAVPKTLVDHALAQCGGAHAEAGQRPQFGHMVVP